MNRRLIIPLLALVLAFAAPLFLTSCNTAQGIGRDISGAGRSVSQGTKSLFGGGNKSSDDYYDW